jgi:hypothetical protein
VLRDAWFSQVRWWLAEGQRGCRANEGQSSDSEMEDTPETRVTLAQNFVGRGNRKSHKRYHSAWPAPSGLGCICLWFLEVCAVWSDEWSSTLVPCMRVPQCIALARVGSEASAQVAQNRGTSERWQGVVPCFWCAAPGIIRMGEQVRLCSARAPHHKWARARAFVCVRLCVCVCVCVCV